MVIFVHIVYIMKKIGVKLRFLGVYSSVFCATFLYYEDLGQSIFVSLVLLKISCELFLGFVSALL